MNSKPYQTTLFQRFAKIVTKQCVKVAKYGVFSGPYFPVIGLNTEIYGVNQFEYRKIRNRKTPYLDTFHAVKIVIG